MFILRHLVFFFFVSGVFAANDGRMRFDGASYPEVPVDEVAAFFNSGSVPFLKIQLGPAEYRALEKEPRRYVSCTVTEGNGTVYSNVAVHLKAGAGSFRQINDRPALTLNFDKYTSQNFHGLGKLNLNNSVQDGTLCHEFVGSRIFRAAGLPVARVSHARVELNGRMLGVYVLLEGFDASFLRLNFGNGYGTFYDGSFREITDDNMKMRASNKGTNYSDLKALKAALEEKDPVKRRPRLETVLDVQKFIDFMICESIVCHWDGYCAACNNYRVYHNPSNDKLVFIGHGMDQIIGDPNYGLVQGRGWVARALTESPEDRRQYFIRFRQLRQLAYREDDLTNAVTQIALRLKPVFDTFDPNAGKNQAGAVADLCRRLIERGKGMDAQLTKELGIPWEPKPLKDWQGKQSEGNAVFDEQKDGDRQCLRIRPADKNAITASWRTHVSLPPGQYVFEGRVRTIDVPPSNDPAQGAALRISGGQRRAGVTGTTDWLKLEYEISTGDGMTDIELVCELKTARGEAWFDKGSLNLVRKDARK